MRIDTLELNNFRNFENKTFRFHPNFTVIIGENGKGKSSILQGLRLAASAFLLGIDEAERYHIQKEDVRRIDLSNRFVPQKNCRFSVEGLVSQKKLHWKRTLSTIGGRTDTKDAADLTNTASDLNRQVNDELKEDVDLPVINFFSTARLWVDSKQTIQLKKKGSKLRDGYARCVDDRSDKTSALEWIKSAYWKKLKNKSESVLLDAVFEAIDTCIPNWTPKEWNEDTDDLGGLYKEAESNESFIPLHFLSDGLRTMAAMVAEIAYRCVVLNAHHGSHSVKQSEGIVLIDQIDMHLHPKWQQNVVDDLRKAFPKIQFVATTHSPFIVQSLNSDQLINLDTDSTEDPYKLTIQDVSSHIMQVEPRSKRFQDQFINASEYMESLNKVTEGSPSYDSEVENLEQMEQEAETNDPAYAAFLKMNRLATLGSSKKK